jgi:hypothetical protein
MMRRMLAIVVRMDETLEELRTLNREQGAINARLTALLERLLPPGGNGQAGREA